VKSYVINNNSVFNIDNSNILFDYTYTNKYNIASTVSCNIAIINYSNLETIDDSNYFNISNYITTTLSTEANPFNEYSNTFQHIYTDFKQSKININEKYIQYSNSYLNTYTTNVLKYNSNISYDGKFYSIHSNYLNITNSANLTAARTLSINVNDVDRTVSLSGNLTVPNAATISGTNTGDQTITLTGDVTGTGTGSFATTLANSGVTASTYRSVTVDSKGRVTAGTNPTTLTGYGITNAVDTSRTITINGTALSLSANRSYSVGTVTSISGTGTVSGLSLTGTVNGIEKPNCVE
jgi:hypothetical protein